MIRPSIRPSFRRRGFPLRPTAALLAVLLAIGATVFVARGAGAAEEGLARTERVTNAAEQIKFGVRMAKRGLWSEALFRFRQAERFDPGNPQILNNIAVSYEALGQFDRALEAYQEAIRADRTNKDLRKNYSRFVEFYRAFRPDEQKEVGGEDQEGDDDQGDDETLDESETGGSETGGSETENVETTQETRG